MRESNELKAMVMLWFIYLFLMDLSLITGINIVKMLVAIVSIGQALAYFIIARWLCRKIYNFIERSNKKK